MPPENHIPYHDVPSAMMAYTELLFRLRVVPVKARDKSPAITKWQYQGIPDRETIVGWSRQFPNMNVGIVLGNGIVAIDVDREYGEQQLEAWSGGNVPDTWEFTTPGGGRRLLFQSVPGIRLATTKETDRSATHDECALMGDGTLTVMPPSVHPNGKLYEWTPGKSPWEILLASIPDWMVAIMSAQNVQPSPSASDPAGGKGRDVLDVLERDCQRFANDWHVQQGAGLPEEEWFRWISHLVKTGNADAAELFSTASHKHNQRSQERLEQLSDPNDSGKSGLCTAFGCSQEQIEACHGKLVGDDGQIKHRPIHHLKRAKQKQFAIVAEDAVRRVESGDRGAHLEPEALRAFAELLDSDKPAYARLEGRLQAKKIAIREFRKDVQDARRKLLRSRNPASSALRDAGFNVNENGEPTSCNPVKFAKYVITQHHLGIAQGNRVHMFENGYWKELTAQDLKRLLMDICESLAPNFWDTDFEMEYLQALYRLATPLNHLNERRDIVNLGNGMLSLHDFKLYPHDPKFESTIRINVELDPSAGYPEFVKFLDSVFQSDNELIEITQEMFGYCLTSEIVAHKCFILYGKGANGKSVLLEVLRELCGPENTSSVSMADLTRDFARHQIVGKTLNISTENEVDKRGLNPQYLKAIVTGDPITVERKYGDPYSYKPFCKLVFALNRLPYSQDKENSFFRRLIILPFRANFKGKQADKRLAEKLLAELPGILNFALEGLKRLRKKDYEFTIPQASAKLLEEYRKQVNPLESFFDEHIVPTPSPGRALRSKIHERFNEWCLENGHKGLMEMSTKRFWKEFRDMLEEKEIPYEEKRSDGRDYFFGITVEGNKPSIFSRDASTRQNAPGSPAGNASERAYGREATKKPSILSKFLTNDDEKNENEDDGPAGAPFPVPTR